jgi:uncharacterized membrane protein YfcA
LEYFLIPLVAGGSALLTFFSGFGLGTLLLPAFLIFFPAPIAILLTAIVHLLNNLFKGTLVFRNASLDLVLRFGIPSIVGAFMGARLLAWLGQSDILYSYSMWDRTFDVTWLNVCLGLLMLAFTCLEWIPRLKDKQLSDRWLIPGGILSGFFGGLSGHQGALRSLFLVKTGISKEVFIGTGVMIAVMVDITRLSAYLSVENFEQVQSHAGLILCGVLAAFGGSWFGNAQLKKVTLEFVRHTVATLMLIISVLMFMGIL